MVADSSIFCIYLYRTWVVGRGGGEWRAAGGRGASGRGRNGLAGWVGGEAAWQLPEVPDQTDRNLPKSGLLGPYVTPETLKVPSDEN